MIGEAVSGEVGIILTDSATADDNRITGRSQLMDYLARSGASNPSAMTASSGNFAIESHGIFEDTEGFFSGDAMDKTLIELTTFGLLHSHQRLDACRF